MIYFADWNDDYERVMITYLKREYEIADIKIASKRIYSINKRIKNNEMLNFLVGKYIKSKYKNLSNDDILIFKESLFYKYIDIIKHIECRKILLLRSSLAESKDVSFSVAKRVFERIYSFDKQDCKKEDLFYLNQFFPFGFKEVEEIRKGIIIHPKQCFFLGRDKGRIEDIEYIAKRLEENSLTINFHVVKDKTSFKKSKYYVSDYLTYDDNIKKSLESEVLLEINREGQSGLTLRTLEAIFFDKKIITNNTDIEKYDFYSPNQFFILGRDSLSEINYFLDAPVTPVKKSILYQYSPDCMLNNIIRDFNYSEIK
ncbi:lipopolysaccharide biosynthesis protein [Pectobacterium cacticida]|uniref:Lipopolysaccharide biosynthesis protein n=1 Tax=Pectobacterium cacticida TaxID=69221 RepID=A0ABZ2GBI4_9GAMM|nr:lipopolysaccharide biosynthesis protein [Pectobacterium cacticida]UYX06615.1 lipopolysaccharide biosynthesis protein [Pectobacterium cacticida]